MGLAAKDEFTTLPVLPQSLSEIFDGQKPAQSKTMVKLAILGADTLGFIIAAVVGTLMQQWYNPSTGNLFQLWNGPVGTLTLTIYASLVFLAVGRFWLLGHYTRRRPFTDELRDVLATLLVLTIADAALMYLAKLSFSRSWFLSTWALAFVLVPCARAFAKALLLRAGQWQIPTIVVGTGPNAREAAAALQSESLMGLNVVAFVALKPEHISTTSIQVGNRAIPVVLLTDPVTEITSIGSPHVVVALEQGEINKAQRLLERLHRKCPELSVVPALRGLPLYGMEVNHFFRHEVLFLRLRNNLARRGPRLIKRAFDVVVSLMLLVLLSPVFAFIAWQIRKAGGPVFFGHTRVGYQGQRFLCYKFRTMIPNAEQVLRELLENDPEARAEWQRDFKLKNDPRITRIGAFLRKTSLDELPQLWNVLRGDMSLVGPRPIIDVELARYGEDVDFYLETRPGMTGLWQISGRNDTDYQTRVNLDTWYVKNWSMWQDIVILTKTSKVLFEKTGAY